MGASDLSACQYDVTDSVEGAAGAVICPGTTEEVAAVVRLA
jgi:FAD/FMN-containing dehydrogenase